MKGHLEPRGKNRWKIVLELGRDANGHRQRRVATSSGGKREAEKELTRLLRELDTGLLVDSARLRTGEYLDKWLEYARASVAPRTAERYDTIARRHLTPALGHHRLDALKPMHIAAYYTEALANGRLDGNGGLSAQTVVHHHRVLHEALRQAVRWQLLASNPADGVDPPKPAKHEMRVLDEDQTRELIKSARDTELFVPILLAATTGMRAGELLGLHWRDVDLEHGKLAVTQSLQATRNGLEFRQPKTAKGRRSIPLIAAAVEALRHHRKMQLEQRMAHPDRYHDNDLVFARENGEPWSPRTFSSSWSRQRDRMGYDIRFHDLRHTHATLLLRQGTHAKVVSERLGHSTVGITLDTYSHVLPDMQEEATARLEAVLGDLLPAQSPSAT